MDYRNSPAEAMIRNLHKNRVGEAVKHVLVGAGVLKLDEPHLDDIVDDGERERALQRARMAAMYSGDAPAHRDEVTKAEEPVATAPPVRKAAWAGSWDPSMSRHERELLAKRVAARQGR